MKVVVITSTTPPSTNLSNWESADGSSPGALAYIGSCDSDGPSLARLHELHPGPYQTATFDIDTTALQGIKKAR